MLRNIYVWHNLCYYVQNEAFQPLIMKSYIKYLVIAAIFILSTELFAQPGLNVQNRINSKVQTRVHGKVVSNATVKATVAATKKATQKAADEAAKTAAVKATVKVGTEINTNKTVKNKTASKKQYPDDNLRIPE